MISDLLYRLRALFRRQSVESELDDELRAHLEHETEKYIESGLSREAAARRARLEFGGMDLVKEECRDARGVSVIETTIQDLRYGLRMLAKSPGFTAVAVLTLALGIGANTAIFSLIDAVMLRMLPVDKPDELLQVKRHDPRWAGEGMNFTNPLWEQVRDQQDVFSGVFAWGNDRFDLAQGGAVHLANGLWVSGDFFNSLRLRPAAGRLIARSDDQRGCPAVAALSYGFWQDHYGAAASAVGSTVSLNGHPFQVIGVAPAGFDGKQSRLDHRSWWWLKIAGRIKPGISPAQLTARLKVLSPAIFTAALPQDWSKDGQQGFLKETLQGDPAATGTSHLRQRFDQPLQVLMAVVGLVLLIACANIASLMLARGAARHKEIAVRQALGASRLRLIRQLLTECLLLSSAGALAGILLARWGTALLVRYLSTARDTVFLDLS